MTCFCAHIHAYCHVYKTIYIYIYIYIYTCTSWLSSLEAWFGPHGLLNMAPLLLRRSLKRHLQQPLRVINRLDSHSPHASRTERVKSMRRTWLRTWRLTYVGGCAHAPTQAPPTRSTCARGIRCGTPARGTPAWQPLCTSDTPTPRMPMRMRPWRRHACA
jgi:hypothetical protein